MDAQDLRHDAYTNTSLCCRDKQKKRVSVKEELHLYSDEIVQFYYGIQKRLKAFESTFNTPARIIKCLNFQCANFASALSLAITRNQLWDL